MTPARSPSDCRPSFPVSDPDASALPGTLLHRNRAALAKIKKQAKNLLRLSQKQNNALSIQTLSEAQELLAQINGYPHWNDLMQKMNQDLLGATQNPHLAVSPSPFTSSDSEHLFFKTPHEHTLLFFESGSDQAPTVLSQGTLMSAFDLSRLPIMDPNLLQTMLGSLQQSTALLWNMELHRFRILIQTVTGTHPSCAPFFLISHEARSRLALTEAEFNQFFHIEPSLSSPPAPQTRALLALFTPQELSDEHHAFSKHLSHRFRALHALSSDTLLELTSPLAVPPPPTEKHGVIGCTALPIPQIFKEGDYEILYLDRILRLFNPPKMTSCKQPFSFNWLYGIRALCSKQHDLTIRVSITPQESQMTLTHKPDPTHLPQAYLLGLAKGLLKQSYSLEDLEAPDLHLSEFNEDGFGGPLSALHFNSPEQQRTLIQTAGLTVDTQQPFPLTVHPQVQSPHNRYIYGRPGSGKSLLLNLLLTSDLLCSPQSDLLPLHYCIDWGPTHQGLFSFLRAALPPPLSSQLEDRPFQNGEHPINPFALPVGFCRPDPLHHQLLVNLLSVMITEPLEPSAPSGCAALLAHLIDTQYDFLSPDRCPKAYVFGQSPFVDEALASLPSTPVSQTGQALSWYELSTHLALAGLQGAAYCAQSYAAPSLLDFCAALQTSQPLSGLYSALHVVSTQEPLLTYVLRKLQEVVRLCPFLSPAVSPPLGARVVSVHLDPIPSSSSYGPQGPRAHHRDAILYCAHLIEGARHSQLISPYPTSDLDEHRCFHPELRQQLLREAAARPPSGIPAIQADEWHRVARFDGLTSSMLLLQKAARKTGARITVTTQMHQPEFLELSSSLYFDPSAMARSHELLISDFQIHSLPLRHSILRTTHSFGTLVCKHLTQLGPLESLIQVKAPLALIMAYSNTHEDMALRTRLLEDFPHAYSAVIRALCTLFPVGTSSRSFIEALCLKQHQSGEAALALTIQQLQTLLEDNTIGRHSA